MPIESEERVDGESLISSAFLHSPPTRPTVTPQWAAFALRALEGQRWICHARVDWSEARRNGV